MPIVAAAPESLVGLGQSRGSLSAVISGQSPLSTITGGVRIDVRRSRPDRVGRAARLAPGRRRSTPPSSAALEPALGPVDDDDLAGAGLARRRHRPRDHRPPAQRVQQLRRGGAHARALPRGEDDDDRRGHVDGSY